MARIRVGGVTGGDPPVIPRIRVGGITASGAAPASSHIRVGGIAGSGEQAVVLLPFTNRTNVEPLSDQTIAAVLAPFSATPDSYAWRIAGGQAVAIVGTGATVHVLAPAHLAGTSVTIGVRASLGSQQSAEQLITITTPPNQDWAPVSGQWVPVPSIVAL